MRHRKRGRVLGRKSDHRQALMRNLSRALILSLNQPEDDPEKAKVPGRIITTLPKAKEVRPFVEKMVTLARKSLAASDAAEKLGTTAKRNSDEWKKWRKSPQWQEWAKAIAPAVALRRKAFSFLRDKEAVRILFAELGPRFDKRDGGYTRIVRLAKPRLGDGGTRAVLEFVGNERDRKGSKKRAPLATESAPAEASAT
ncbi:MAG: 50S ribosomal protein L17 [Planctomycetaceae bacterium]|nr:50S ribosomal protein L17 [Planctomycetaceae bacterium]